MNFLPSSSIDIFSTAADYAQQASHSLDVMKQGQSQEKSFDKVYSSFIEEGREDYTGLPSGFSALVEEGGTITRDAMDHLKDELRKRNVQDASLESLEQMLASGAPMSVGRIFGVLAGESRASLSLSDDESAAFKRLMQKLQFSADETDELLGMSDKGQSVAVWRHVSNKINALGDSSIQMDKAEFTAFLRSLDLPESSIKQMNGMLENSKQDSFNKQQLMTLLGQADKELADKELAANAVIATMREAMVEALKTAKREQISAPTADTRGSNRSLAAEQRMQLNLRKGATNMLMNGEGKEIEGEAQNNRDMDFSRSRDGDAHDLQDGKSRTDRILFTNKATEKTSDTPSAPASKADPFDSMMERITLADTAAMPSGAEAGHRAAPEQVGKTFQQAIFSHVEQGNFKTAQNGVQQLTFNITPERMGEVTVVLSMHQGELRAMIRTENEETNSILTDQIADIKAALEEQGLKVAEVEVETRLGEDTSANQWNGSHQHNLMRDAQERDRFSRLAQLRREAGEERRTLQAPQQTAPENGLHVVA